VKIKSPCTACKVLFVDITNEKNTLAENLALAEIEIQRLRRIIENTKDEKSPLKPDFKVLQFPKSEAGINHDANLNVVREAETLLNAAKDGVLTGFGFFGLIESRKLPGRFDIVTSLCGTVETNVVLSIGACEFLKVRVINQVSASNED